MENALKRKAARLILGGREATIIRIALASRYAALFENLKNRVPDRFALWTWISREVMRGDHFDYLEFGVFRGESIARVASLNRNPNVRLFGFDSFEGLPRDWIEGFPKGTFNVDGHMPAIVDDRVRFVKGWFDRSLPNFLFDYQPQRQLWLHMDADLYGSTMTVLTLLNSHIRSGTIVVFDDFQDLLNDFKALCDFQDMSGKRLDLLAATNDFRHAAFVCR